MTGQWLTPADGIRWFYDSGALSLDFAHTGAVDAFGEPPAEVVGGVQLFGAGRRVEFAGVGEVEAHRS